MIALTLVIATLQAPGVVRGRVADAATTLPVAEAIVIAGGETVRTGATGRFTVTGLPAGAISLHVRRLGYAAAEVPVMVTPGAPVDVEITLAPLPVALEAVAAQSAAPVLTLSGEEVRRRGATLAEALDGWQGVVVVRRGSGSAAAPIIRGSTADEVLVLVDGVPLNDPLTAVADLSRIGAADVQRVTLVPGARAAQFGARALAGVLVIETGPRRGTSFGARVGSYGAIGVDATGRLDVEAWQLGASAAVETAADGYPVSLPASRGGGERERENAGATQLRLSLRVAGPVAGAVRGHWVRRGLPGTLANPSRTGWSEERWMVVTAWTGAARLSAEVLSSDVADPSPPLGLPFASRLRAGGAEGALGFQGWGVDVELGGRVDVLGGSALAETETAARGHVSASRAVTTRAGGWHLTFTPVARFDVWNRPGSPAVSLRGDLAAEHDALLVRLGAGSSASHPVLADHLFHQGVGVRPNPDLLPERVPWEVDGGLDWQWRAGATGGVLGARGYHGRVHDLVLWAPDFRFVWSPNNWDVRRSGVELHARGEGGAGRWTADASFGLTRVRYDRPGGPQVIYRPTDVGSVRVGWHPTERWDAWLQLRRVGTRYPNHGGVNGLPPATTVDAGLAHRARLGAAVLSAAIEVRDVTDRRLEFIAGQPLPGRMVTFRLGFERP